MTVALGPASPTPPFSPAGGGRFSTVPKDVVLKPGQIVHFKPGKGYYSGPAVSAPPVSGGAASTFTPTATPASDVVGSLAAETPAQIQQDATNQATAEVQGNVAPVQQAGAQNDAIFKAQQLEAAGFNAAANKLLASIGPQIQAGYGQAAKETGQLSKGFTSSVQGQLTAEQAAGANLAAKLGATGGNAPSTVDPSAFGNALYMQNGFIPGTLLTQQGAHARQQAANEQVVNTDVGRAEQQGLQAAQSSADLKTAQQIAAIAAKYPSLFTAAEHADITASVNAAKTQSDIGKDQSTEALNTAKTQEYYDQATHLHNEDVIAGRKLNVSIDALNAKIDYQNGELKIRGTSADAAWLRAQTAAHGIDASASKDAGHLIMKNGQPVLTKAGQYIQVDKRVYSSASLKNTPLGVYRTMVKQAASDFKSQEKPELVPTGSPAGGKYVLNPNIPPQTGDVPGGTIGSVQYPASTNDPSRAAIGSAVTFAQKLDQYVQQFGVTRAQARKALIAGGWKPEGKRTKKTIRKTGP